MSFRHTFGYRSNRKKYLLLAAVILTLVLSYFLIPGVQDALNESYQVFTSGDRERVSGYIRSFGAWGPLLIVLIMVIQMFLIVVPSWLLMVVSVIAYHPFWGVILSMVAVFIASTVGYMLGRWVGEVAVSNVVGEKGEKSSKRFIEKYGFGGVFLFRLVPFLSNDAISLVGGMLRMRYWRFIGATMGGTFPLALLIAYFAQDTETLKRGLYWIGGGGLLLYGGYVVWDHWFREREPSR